MVLLRGQWISVPAYCYPRYDYLSERADTLINYFEGIEGSAKFRRCLNQGEERLGSIIRNGKTLKSKLNLLFLYENEDSDFLEPNQFLVKDVGEEDKTEPVAVSWEEILEQMKTTKDVDLSTVCIVVLSGEPSEVLKKVDDPDILRALPQQHSYFVNKDKKECCKMEDISNLDKWTSNLSHLVQSGLEKTVMDVVKQMEQFMAELLPGKRASIQCNIIGVLQKSLEDWLGNEDTKRDFFSITQPQGPEGTSKTSEGELTTIFRQKMQDSLSRETKRYVLDFVAQCHGLNPSFTNHFLLNKLDFEDALKKTITTMSMPSYSDLKMSYKSVVKMVTSDYITAIIPLINSVESLVTNLVVILERMHRLQFLTHALLRMSPLTCKTIKEPSTLPKELQQDLLKKPFVTGCGTIYGELVIHVKSAIHEQQKEDIECCLSLYGYVFPYKIEVFIPIYIKTAGLYAKQGDIIRATENNGLKYKYGTLGCFVDVKYKERDEQEVHFITCYHCLEGCYKTVSVKKEIVRDIGSLKHHRLEADIALVQVKECDLISKLLLHINGENEIDRWQFFQEDNYIGRLVYKVGGTSGITKGYVVSDNYQGKAVTKLAPDLLFIITPQNALKIPIPCKIEADMPGAGVFDKPYFSYKGDSGSVVCDIDPESGYGRVLGFLHGRLDIDSCAIKMNSALNMLKEKYSEIESIEPSLDQDQFPDLPGAAAY